MPRTTPPDLWVTASRLPCVQDVEEYAGYLSFADDLDYHIRDLWSYIDGRDTGTAIERALPTSSAASGPSSSSPTAP
ncbi:hypothetical protein [Streptomyces sp. NPDC017673]|uniref:hypothetical protein n=1 Tax=unclassified Streptomyces TaxID=2593676 RepID=UPI00379BA46C